MTNAKAVLLGLGAIGGIVFLGMYSNPTSALAEGKYLITGGDGPGGAWRINTASGAVSFCDARIETRGAEYSVKCTAWSE